MQVPQSFLLLPPTVFLLAIFSSLSNITDMDDILRYYPGRKREWRQGPREICTGLFCHNASTATRANSSRYVTGTNLALALADLFAGKTVASYGKGSGQYKSLLERTGKVKTFDSFVVTPSHSEKEPKNSTSFLDLTTPQSAHQAYDWILCLEVAEHIPENESLFLDNLARPAREGVVLSWARPELGQTAQVNSKTEEYVIDGMAERGFAPDRRASERLQSVAELKTLQDNVHVFLKTDSNGKI